MTVDSGVCNCRVKAKKELQSLLDADPEPTVEKLLSHPPLVLVVREIEKLLLGMASSPVSSPYPPVPYLSVLCQSCLVCYSVGWRRRRQGRWKKTLRQCGEMWKCISRRTRRCAGSMCLLWWLATSFVCVVQTLEAAVTERLKDYQDMIKFQGKDAAFTIITAEAFAKSKGGGLREAAAMQIKMNHFNETLEDSTNQIIDKYREMQLEMKDYYQDLFTGLLKTYCNVDDSMVDYVNIWQRRFDPITTR